MSDFVFVTMSHDYADEFDVDCSFVAERADFEKQMEVVRLAFEAGVLEEREEFYFGTNEALSFYSFDDFEGGVSVQNCSEDFYHEFIALCGGGHGFNVLESMYETAIDRAEEMKQESEDE